MKSLLNLFFGKSLDEQMENYILKNGYPDHSVVFVDRQGNYGQLIGINTFKNASKKDNTKLVL